MKKKLVLRVLNILLMFGAWWYLASKIKSHQYIFEQLTQLQVQFFKNYALVIVLIGLMIFNWSLEARKWQLLTTSIQKTTFLTAFKQTWIGLAWATFLPLGNFFGRTKNLPTHLRYQSAGALLINGFSQFWVSIAGGIVALGYFLEWNVWVCLTSLLIWVVLSGLLMWLVLKNKWESFFSSMYSKNQWFTRIKFYLFQNASHLHGYTLTKLSYVFGLSLMRYTIFLLQMVLLFYVAGVKLPIYVILIGSALVFAAKSVLPVSGFLVGLSVREATALYFFSSLGEEQIILLTFLLWVLNIGIPVFLGSLWSVFSKK